MSRWLRSTAMAIALGFVSFAAPDLFIYKSAHAETGTLPSWISNSCCGAQDAHRLKAGQVYRNENGTWHADGYPQDIPDDPRVKPSEDGNAWAFYREKTPENTESMVYCLFFVPSI